MTESWPIHGPVFSPVDEGCGVPVPPGRCTPSHATESDPMATTHTSTLRATQTHRPFRKTLSVSVATAVVGSLTLVPATVAASPSENDAYRGEIEVVSG